MPVKSFYTAGYEGLDIETFIQNLQQTRVNAVVDVRELPLSRKKGFSKTAFAQQLASSGIDYVHMSALGCPKSIRNRYRLDSDWAAYSADFKRYLKTQQSALIELTKIAKNSTVCLVCFEADYLACHRTYVARAAYDLGAPQVKHLGAKTATLDSHCRLAA